MSEELLPCPFCGGAVDTYEIAAHTHEIATFMPDHPGSFCIECHTCGVGILRETKPEAIAAWNKRGEQPQRDAAVRARALEEAAVWLGYAHNYPVLAHMMRQALIPAPPAPAPDEAAIRAELVAALRTMLSCWQTGYFPPVSLEAARAALAKAGDLP